VRGERFSRPWLAVLVVGLALVVVLAGAVYVALRPSGPASPALSPLDEALQGINDDGTFSKETALKAFAAAIGPLPGVPTPRVDKSYHSGTLALNMVIRYWSDLSDDQRRAVRDYLGPPAVRVLPAAFFAGGLVGDYQAIADADIADIEARLGRKLGVPLTVVLGDKNDPGGAWAVTGGSWTGPPGSGATECTTTIPPDTASDRSRDPYMRWVLLHEMWHCFEYAMASFDDFKKAPPWITEGQASFVAEAITGGEGRPPPEFDHWRKYVEHPEKPLFGRAYDAVGFYPQLVHNNIDAWMVLQPMLQAGGSDQALVSSGASQTTFTDRWGSSWFRDGAPNESWEMNSGYGIPSTAYRAAPQDMQITDGSSDTMSAPPNAGAVAAVHTTAFVTEFQAVGSGRVADPGSSSLDRVVRSGVLDLCTSPSGSCACPPGSSHIGPEPERAPQNLHAAVTGEPRNLSVMTVTGISKDEWCRSTRTPPPSKPCNAGCGGSNGDPHLKTIDGSRYDLQAAGEYVMLRAPDGSIEVQARQEPRGTNVTINTALAARVNGHRVAFYVAEAGPPTVLVDGQGIEAGVAATDLGPGARLTQYPRGYELDFPDGTKLWALSVGSWGINLLVLPSNELRSNGRGLIAGVSSSARFRVPMLPDGSTLPAPTNRQDHYRLLYEVLAPAWRVTGATTLFDYDAGKTTDTFTVAGFPPESAPLSNDDVDPGALATAQTTCAGVTDADLASQCAFDVAITGESQFATLYIVSDGLESSGTDTLSQPPPTLPPEITPAPSQGQLPADINFVADHLAGVSSRLLAPNGMLYVNVVTQAEAFGDVAYALLEVDPASGQIIKRADAAGPGMLAWAAGSIWVGEFGRSAIGVCEISRLDAASLAVQATIPTVCGDQLLTVLTSIGDDVWFADSTGAAADGTGAHLRRIDPLTNAVDPAPGSNLELPFLPQFVLIQASGTVWSSTSAGLIFGNRQAGLFRLLAGSDSFDSLGVPGNGLGWFAAGDGVWTETDTGENGGQGSAASFYNGGDQPTLFVGFDGYLAGADDEAVYVEYELDTDVGDSLVRYPADGSAPTTVAVGGFVANSFGGTTTLGYNDSLINPLLFSNGMGVKSWVAPTASDELLQQLLVQVLNLP
jgi:hypothetical protein